MAITWMITFSSFTLILQIIEQIDRNASIKYIVFMYYFIARNEVLFTQGSECIHTSLVKPCRSLKAHCSIGTNAHKWVCFELLITSLYTIYMTIAKLIVNEEVLTNHTCSILHPESPQTMLKILLPVNVHIVYLSWYKPIVHVYRLLRARTKAYTFGEAII